MRQLLSLLVLAGCAEGLSAIDVSSDAGLPDGHVPRAPDARPSPDGATPVTACSPAETTHSRAAEGLAFSVGGTLADPEITLRVCTTHFPPGSAARAEVAVAVALYNGVAGTAARITIEDTPHRGVAELFGRTDDDAVVYLDHLETAADGYPGFPCHPQPDDTSCGSWVMNTCRYRGGGRWGGGVGVGFNISVNARCYAAGDFPLVGGLAHELGHGFGMNHTDVWPAEQRAFSSTMQGLHPILTAWDEAFLRDRYPTSAQARPDLVASPVVRIASSPEAEDGTRYKKCFFSDEPKEDRANPRELFRDGAALRDCATGDDPVFFTTWFNLSSAAAPAAITNRLTLSAGGEEVVIDELCAAAPPPSSEDRRVRRASVPAAAFAGLADGAPLTLRFTVDDRGAVREASEDNNTVETEIVLRASRASCRPAHVPACVTSYEGGFR